MKPITAVMTIPAISLALLLALPAASGAQTSATSEQATEVRYEISAERSWLRVLVYRGGLLGGLGHNHVVSHNELSGSVWVQAEPLRASFAVELVVADFDIDNADNRAIEGDDFPGAVPAKDIAGTRKNLLGRKLLDAANFPTIQLQSADIRGDLPDIDVPLVISVRGSEHTLVVPATINLAGDRFVATGQVTIRHRDIGLSPFKAAFGALRVRDEMLVKFALHGDKVVDDHNVNNKHQ